jgi:hypothetical protein
MKIAQGQVAMGARASQAVRTTSEERLRVQVQSRPATTTPARDTYLAESEDPALDPKLEMLLRLIESLTGHKIHRMKPAELRGPSAVTTTTPAAAPVPAVSVSYSATSTTMETAHLAFAAQGAVTTEDGRAIDFSLELDVQRQFVSHESLSITTGAAATDPLVLNLAGFTGRLAGGDFTFDLDADGTTETLQSPGAGHPFLTLDRDGDGQVTDGRELFGPATGSGFTELAGLDGDANGWIDENDTAFTQLRLWTPGSDTVGLADAGVGAIALASAAAPFALKDAHNTLTGISQRTGIYLHEDGTPGTVQQIDLVG